MKKSLRSLNEDWDVWIDWYEDRLNGVSLEGQADLEIAKLESLEKNWEKGAKFANAELRKIINQHRIFIQGDGLLTYGVQYRQVEHYLRISGCGDKSDIGALEKPSVHKLFDTIQRKTQELKNASSGIGENLDWGLLEDAVLRIQQYIQGELSDIPDNILLIFDHTLELAGFLEESKALAKSPQGNRGPLPPSVTRSLQNLINSLAPWVREFPSALEQDIKLGETLARPELFIPCQTLFDQAHKQNLLTKDDCQLLINLIGALNQNGATAQKRAVLAQGGAVNFVIKAVALTLSFYAGAASSAIADESIIVQNAKKTILGAESAIIEIMSEASDDARLMVIDSIARLKQDPDEQDEAPDPLLMEPKKPRQPE